MSETQELPGLSAMSLKMDMIQFQDEILKDMRQMQTKLDIKYAKTDDYLNESITKFDSKIKSFEKKINELSKLITIDNSIIDKIESLFKFKEETQDTIFKRRAKFDELEKRINDNIFEINKTLTNTVIYPGIIGKKAKFQTFHEFIDFAIQEITQLNIFKNKSQMDSMSAFKKKIDGVLEAFKIQINNLTPKEVTNQLLSDLEQKMNSIFKLYDERLQDSRAQNANYSIGLQKNMEEMNKQISNFIMTQNFIIKKLEKLQNPEIFNIINNEINEINVKIYKIFDILRDLAAFHPEVKKNYHNDLDKKSTKKIFSGVKEYIKGNINADELMSMKKFSYERSKTKVFDKSSPNTNMAQNAASEYSVNNYISQNPQNVFLDNKREEAFDFANKKYMRKNSLSLNLSKGPNVITNNLTQQEEIKRGKFYRKNTVSFRKNAYMESSKINNSLTKSIKNNNFNNRIMGEKAPNIIEEENEINNNSNNSDSESDSGNKYITSLKNKNNKNNNNGDNNNIKAFNIQNDNAIKENLDVNKTDNNKEIKIDINENNKDNDSIKVKEKKTLIYINNDIINKNIKNISRNDFENKKEISSNSNKNNNNHNKEKIKDIKHFILTESNPKNIHTMKNKFLFLNEDSAQNKYPISSKLHPKVTKLNLQNTNKSQESLSSQSEGKNNRNQISEGNQISIPMNYNFKSKNQDKSISPTSKLYKTFSNFPKIIHDNNISIPLSKDKFSRTIREGKFFRKDPKAISSSKYKKKILWMNPDAIPLNNFEKTFQDIFKNNLHITVNKSVRIKNNKINDYSDIKYFGKK